MSEDAYIDDAPFDSRLLDRACEVCRTYADDREPGDYRHLLIICGTPKALEKYTRKRNGDFIDGLKGVSFFNPDEDVHELFERMQKPEGGHRDLALSFDDKGVVYQNSVEIMYKNFNRIENVCNEVSRIKGEVGAGHIALIRGSMNSGMHFGIGLSEDTGTVIPFVGGRIYRPSLYIPEKKIIVPKTVDAATTITSK